ncbi:hypothetical protein BgiBS90_004062, partial [Biomphalaria glabrata]
VTQSLCTSDVINCTLALFPEVNVRNKPLQLTLYQIETVEVYMLAELSYELETQV